MENEIPAFSELQDLLDKDVDKTTLKQLIATLGNMSKSALERADAGLQPAEFSVNEKYLAALVAASETFQAYWVTKNM